MNIALFKEKDILKYSSTNYYVDQIANEFIRMGHNVKIIDIDKLEKEKEENSLEEIFENVVSGKRIISVEEQIINILKDAEIEFVLSIDCINYLPIDVYEELEIVLGIVLTKHPFNYIDEIDKYRSYVTFITMIDEEMLNTFSKYIDNLTLISWLMDGGTKFNIKFEKKYDIAICDSLFDLDGEIRKNVKYEEEYFNKLLEILYKKSNEESLKKSLDEIVEELLNGKKKNKEYYKRTLDSYLNEIISESKLSDVTQKSIEYRKKIADIYNYVNFKNLNNNKENVIRELLKNGYKINYFGTKDMSEFEKYNNFVIHEVKSYKEIISNVLESKMLICNLPYYKNGSNEIINTAMLNKTMVISNINNYCNNKYIDNDNIVFFDINDLEGLNSKIKHYLDDDDEYNKVIEKAYNITLQNNTWDNRVDELIQIYEKMKENI